MCEEFFHWEENPENNFRILKLDIDNDIEKEFGKLLSTANEYKQCCVCKEHLPANTYFFTSFGKRGLHPRCKKCEGKSCYGWGRIENNKFNEAGFHYCSTCDRVLPLNILYFNKTKGKCNKTGYSSNCKECKGYKFDINSINDLSDIFGIKQEYKVCHSCMLELPNFPYYWFKKPNREHGSTICKQCLGYKYGTIRINRCLHDYLPKGLKMCNRCGELVTEEEYNKNQCCNKCIVEYRQVYNQKESTKLRLRRFSEKRRYKKRLIKCDLTTEEWAQTLNYFNNECAYCGMTNTEHLEKFNERLHQEHIVPLLNNGEYTKNNIIPACRSCNASKGLKSLEDFFNYKDEFSQDKYNKIIGFLKELEQSKEHVETLKDDLKRKGINVE